MFCGMSMFLCKIYYDNEHLNASAGWLGCSIGGVALFLMCIIGLRGTHLVNLELLLTYFWGIAVFISILILVVVSCFNSYLYISIWLKHSWQNGTFDDVRQYFCEPKETYDGKCLAPIDVGDITVWCKKNFDAIDCQSIRDKAVSKALTLAQSLTLAMGLIGVFDLAFILISIYLCFKILTAPVITASMNDVINYLLLLPMCGCLGMAVYLSQLSILPYYSGLSYLNAALVIAQFIALPIGVYAGRNKSKILITCYIILISLITFGFISAGSVGLIYSGLITETFQPSVKQTADIACQKRLGCCCCDQENDRCPEWTQTEVTAILSLDLQVAGFVAVVSIIYLLGAFIIGFVVKNNLKDYKSDYI
jgi:hypothetical protein